MLRGDSAARSAYYGSLAALGSLSPNDIRRLEDMPPIPSAGADQYYLPANNLSPLSAIAGEAGKPDAGTSAAVLSILQAVAAGTITAASAEALILATFPELPASSVRAMVEGAEPAAEESTEPVAVEPANETEDTGEDNGN
jgi:hypothetical protein